MDLSGKIQENEENLKPLRERAKELEVLEMYSGQDKMVSFSDLMAELKSEDTGAPEKIICRIPKLDQMVDGFRPGQLIVVSAPTGNGKTALLQHFTSEFQDQANCAWFSYEVPPREFEDRFFGKVPHFYLPRQNKESSLEWLRQRIIEGIAKHNTRVVFIDHLHYLLDLKMLYRIKNTSLAIGVLMRELKKIAIQYEIIIFLVSHLAKTKLENTPQIDDLRDSSFVGQESDIVLVMWRVMEKDKENRKRLVYTNETMISVEKNRRNGRTGYVKTLFNEGRFIEIDSQHEES